MSDKLSPKEIAQGLFGIAMFAGIGWIGWDVWTDISGDAPVEASVSAPAVAAATPQPKAAAPVKEMTEEETQAEWKRLAYPAAYWEARWAGSYCPDLQFDRQRNLEAAFKMGFDPTVLEDERPVALAKAGKVMSLNRSAEKNGLAATCKMLADRFIGEERDPFYPPLLVRK